MSDRITETVVAALARQLNLPAAELSARLGARLEDLGLDSHGLLRVLLDLERALGLPAGFELPDHALESPATMVAGVAAVAG